MSIVTTDDKHYKDIAAKIREKAGTDETFKPAEMAGGIDAVYEAGKAQVSPSTPTDNRTSLAYWYQYLCEGRWELIYDETGMWVDTTGDESTWIDTVEFPKGVQNVTDFKNLFQVYITDDLGYHPHFLPVKNFTGSLDMSKATSARHLMKGFVSEDYSNITFPDVSKFTDFAGMFFDNKKLTTVSRNMVGNNNTVSLDTSNGTNFFEMFWGCSSLISASLDTSNGTNFYYMHSGNTALLEAPRYDVSKGELLTGMFSGCTNLRSIGWENANTGESIIYDCRNATNVSGIMNYCKNITTIRLKNIKANLTIGSGSSYGHLLDLDSLIFTIRELRDTGATKTLTMGTTNLAKLANTYVRVVDITDEMRAEDDLIDEKLPFEICKSTDSGSTLITEYVKLKNWTLK